jgi:hydrogenase maturation protease
VTDRILVAGLGNVLMSDDGIGPYCVQHLSARYEFPAHVEVADLGTPGLDLALHLSSADIVLVIDALRDAPPGTIAVYDFAAVFTRRTGTRLETHSPALEESILIARLAAERPRDVRLIGLAGESFEHGTALSPGVRARIPSLIDAVLAELTDVGVGWTPLRTAVPRAAWWEHPPAAEL